MSSRVSRLAQIRQRRDKVQDESGDSVEADVKNEVITESAKINDNEKSIIGEVEIEAAHESDSGDLEEKIPDAIDENDQARLYRNLYEQTGVFELDQTDSEPAVSYNSDLKEDLAQLYGRAHHGTERVINAIIQKKYQERLAQ